MEQISEVLKITDKLINKPKEIEKIQLPALKEVIEHVASTKGSGNSYTKHTAHTQSNTKACAMGCIGGWIFSFVKPPLWGSTLSVISYLLPDIS